MGERSESGEVAGAACGGAPTEGDAERVSKSSVRRRERAFLTTVERSKRYRALARAGTLRGGEMSDRDVDADASGEQVTQPVAHVAAPPHVSPPQGSAGASAVTTMILSLWFSRPS
jgi:hypothetical protein